MNLEMRPEISEKMQKVNFNFGAFSQNFCPRLTLTFENYPTKSLQTSGTDRHILEELPEAKNCLQKDWEAT